MSNHSVNVLNNKGELVKVAIAPDVYRYIKQLEGALKYPIRSKI